MGKINYMVVGKIIECYEWVISCDDGKFWARNEANGLISFISKELCEEAIKDYNIDGVPLYVVVHPKVQDICFDLQRFDKEDIDRWSNEGGK